MNNKKSKKKVVCIIPARFESTRLPGKPLINISGKPLIQWVWEAAVNSAAIDKVFIATDDARIADFCKSIGAEFIMTPNKLQSGSDRIAFAYDLINENTDFILNIQGDEPLIKPLDIENLINQFIDTNADVGTLIKKINIQEEIFDTSIVKVVIDKNKNALYFSRSPIPHLRDVEQDNWLNNQIFWKHIGIYLYNKQSLIDFSKLKPTKLELSEKLEQLRLLENGAKFFCVETDSELIGVDNIEDINKVEKALSVI